MARFTGCSANPCPYADDKVILEEFEQEQKEKTLATWRILPLPGVGLIFSYFSLGTLVLRQCQDISKIVSLQDF